MADSDRSENLLTLVRSSVSESLAFNGSKKEENTVGSEGLARGGLGCGFVTVKMTADGLQFLSFCRKDAVLSNTGSACCGAALEGW